PHWEESQRVCRGFTATFVEPGDDFSPPEVLRVGRAGSTARRSRTFGPQKPVSSPNPTAPATTDPASEPRCGRSPPRANNSPQALTPPELPSATGLERVHFCAFPAGRSRSTTARKRPPPENPGMALRAYWTGNLKISLVTFGVRLYNAVTESEKVRLN